jgi:AcrR family transcriptional regulator
MRNPDALGEIVSMTTDDQKPKRPRTKAGQRAVMVEQILDGAEELFAQRGLYGVTLKDVAVRVGIHTSLLHYYFADKNTLFEAVFARRAAVTVERRTAALDRYAEECGGKPTVEGALRAFLDPDLVLFLSGDPGWQNYGTLGAQVSVTPDWGAKMFDVHFDGVVLKLIGLLRTALPGCSEEDIFWGYHFTTGALVLTLARTGRIDTLSNGICKSDDLDAVKERMASFLAAGFAHICRERVEARKKAGSGGSA